ncbi:MAG TPA: type I DNA topoisomerase [Candidatus Peribacter riflensis]|uniref:DNA topoisomerase 1 n=1 Tax=Candidatus Peribacter riflensis TaxID=1735162 RepID=A0A0S1SXK8_9BACT|nr:MAG: DNA topoisomerase I [Candidatus Peribacter riflensis]ALM11547.1 MAG: DNA topoisomerase I [Candidatus Peribacter riflensis]ALM12649.1 MAG: DNA topoisomerase I [Candidatus Peribacter riflensis]ALM13750.1 MAG: DNA topoisomerase I [Candidatus Peribacter riflensis]ALM14853.1 MAG: DNA topoisomerase I [Candidatus Peribacter riflensis]
MPSHLVIVESPTKAKTIKRFLGKDFDVEASMGHVRDLPEGSLGVDTEDFSVKYVIPKEKAAVVKRLQKSLDSASDLWIATDEDREGEAIGWHLTEILKRKKKQPIRRIVFHEITKEAIEAAVEHPRKIDEKLVDAQHARRILDRLVGYTLSPFLWKKVYRGLSAGRVQSVAVRIIVDRERAIKAFHAEEYWTVTADLLNGAQQPFSADLKQKDGKKFVPVSDAQAQQVLADLKGASYSVQSLEEKEIKKTPPPPFTTSTLQQEAGRKLGFSVKQTMMVAQQLYEGVDLGKGEGHVGLITYMRTDSVNLSDKALADARETIQQHYGREYILSSPRKYKTKSKGAQEAHEAIRPTEMARVPESLKDVLDHQQLKLYTLIWERAVATQMAEAQLKRVGADIRAGAYTFRATGQTIAFDGYLRVYLEGRDEPESQQSAEEEEDAGMLPPLQEGETLECKSLLPEQHFTKPPPRYTEASLVKKLEEEGIGRPSTYAPTISTVQQRGYIKKEGKQLIPEDIAFTVTDLLTEHFPDIVDLTFTAKMEQSLDDIAESDLKSVTFLRGFYKPFHKLIESKTVEVKKGEVLKDRVIGIDPDTKLEVLARTGRFGPYIQLGRIELKPGEKMKNVPKPKSASIPKTIGKDAITLEQALSLLAFPRVLGEKDGQTIEVHLGRFGPYIKWGKATTSLGKDQEPAQITKEEAIAYLASAKDRKAQAAEPLRSLGQDAATGAEVQVKTGRYGPYVTDGKTNCSLPKRFTPEAVTLEEASDLLAKKRARGPSKWKGRGWGKK